MNPDDSLRTLEEYMAEMPQLVHYKDTIVKILGDVPVQAQDDALQQMVLVLLQRGKATVEELTAAARAYVVSTTEEIFSSEPMYEFSDKMWGDYYTGVVNAQAKRAEAITAAVASLVKI